MFAAFNEKFVLQYIKENMNTPLIFIAEDDDGYTSKAIGQTVDMLFPYDIAYQLLEQAEDSEGKINYFQSLIEKEIMILSDNKEAGTLKVRFQALD